MQLSLDLAVIDGFRSAARHISNTLYHIDVAGNYFRQDALNANLPNYEVTDSLRCFCPSDVATIVFSDIQPVDILSIELGAPIRFNEEEKDVSLKSWRNDSSEPWIEKVKESQEETITEERNILTQIATSIKAKVGGGGPVFQASLEAELSAKLGIDLKSMRQHKVLSEREVTITTPPWTETSITQRHSVADVKQTVKMNCLVDARVALISHGSEATPWTKTFESLRELERYLRGGGGGSDDNTGLVNTFVNKRVFQDFEIPADCLELSVEEERFSRNVNTGETDRKDIPIKRPDSQKRKDRRERRRKKRRKSNE